MKSRKVTFTLIVSVIAVWGIIIYRVLTAAAKGDEWPAPRLAAAVSKEPLEDYEVPDTFKLALNYRDPFLDKAAAEEPQESSVPASGMINPVTPPPAVHMVNWDFLKYSGYITNPDTKKMVAIISINNRERMLSEGETAEGVRLLKTYKDSVKVSFEGKTKFLVLN